ncbi:hypothetical protein D3C80_2119720 [compost metagenome]
MILMPRNPFTIALLFRNRFGMTVNMICICRSLPMSAVASTILNPLAISAC